jgi:hypothetical protein
MLAFILTLFIAVAAQAQDKAKDKPTPKDKKKSKFKKYEDIVSKEAKTKKGIFIVHQVDEKLYYEISPKMMGKEFLWVAQLAKAQTGYGHSGYTTAKRVVRWERMGNNILLRDIKYTLQAKEGTPEALVVKTSSLPAVIGSYKIVCFSKDKTPVIDVTPLFTGDVPEFSPKRRINATSIDKKRTFISSVKVFPLNIETRVLATYRPKPPKPLKGGYVPRPKSNSITVELHHSMVRLPEKPMMPRIADDRVGFFATEYQDYSGADQQQVHMYSVIERFRLEKKNPNAKISEPVKPIVFYVGRGVPEKYKPYVKQGIEAWNEAFEQAGFKNAIIGKYAPGKKEDPDWDAEDARYSSIRWLPSTIQNAMGPNVVDPRSGETLEADVLMFHNVLKLARDWFYVQASPNEPKAQKLPFPDDLMGKLIRYVACHEVGHSLGLRHNYKASAGMTIKQIRDAAYTKKHGHTPSIMDYARFNYVAQPGDGASLIPRIGAYDRFAIEWGYKQFSGIKSPEAERSFLNKIAARQVKNPLVRFGKGREAGPIGGADHTAQSEDLSSDAIEATTLGLKNLERVMGYIVKGTSKEGEDYKELRNMYGSATFQLIMELGHVARLVGGVEIHNKVHGMKGDFYTPLNINKQKQAVQFLDKNCFVIPKFFLKKDVIKRLGMHDVSRRLGNVQTFVLRTLLSSNLAARIGDIEAAGYKTYAVVEIVGDLSAGIFSETRNSGAKIDILRRNLQRSFTNMLITNLNNKKANGDLRAASRFHLTKLAKTLKTYSAGNDITGSHIMDLYEQISKALKSDQKN